MSTIDEWEVINGKVVDEMENDIGQWVGCWVGGVGKIDGGHQVADTPTQLLDTHSLQV